MMYRFLSTDDGTEVDVSAANLGDAVWVCERRARKNLTLTGDARSTVAYWVDEFQGHPHWINPTIPVYFAAA